MFKRKKIEPEYVGALIFSAFIPILIMILIFISRGIFPFGNYSFLRSDMYHQYAPFFQEFRDKLTSGDSLLYSWNIGGGTNFAALYAYYLASPFNWLLILVPKAYVIEFMTYLIVLKVGLCGLSFTWYLSRHCRTTKFSLSLFGICYALSGYMAAYSWNIMWLDCIILLPLIVYGLEQLVKRNRCFLYCVTLGLSILSNYYISIMTCIFLVLYFIFLVVIQEKITVKKVLGQIGCFALFSLLAGGIAAVVLLPEIYALGTTASSNSTFPQQVSSYFSILQMLARHLVMVPTEIGLDHWPNLFCGVGVLLLVPLYAMNRRYSYKEKIGYMVLIFFFLASFSLNSLNFIWHGLHYPNSLPCRQSFLYIFLVLVVSYKGFLGIQERSNRQVITAFWIAVAFVVAVQAICEDEAITWSAVWFSLLFIGLYALLIYHHRRRRADPLILVVLALTFVSAENSFNTNVTSITTVNRDTYMDIDDAAAELNARIAESNPGFYRMEKVAQRTKNDGAWLSYPSASTFSSMSYASMTSFYKEMGMEGSTNSFSTNGATPFAYSLLGVRYLLSVDTLPDSSLYSLAETAVYPASAEDLPDNSLYLYENLYTLPLGFVLPNEMATWQCNASNPFAEQDSFVSAAAGTPSMFQMLEPSVDGHACTITVTSPGVVYVYTGSSVKEVNVAHGNFSRLFSNVNRGYLMNLGYCNEGETIIITGTSDDDILNVTAAVFQEDAFIQAYEKLSQYPMTVESYSSGHITASLTTDDGLLVTTIPYDKGWSLKVDGVSVQPSSFVDTFLCFSIGAGTHTLEFDYTPQGVKTGGWLSVLSAAAALILYVVFRIWEERRPLDITFTEDDLDLAAELRQTIRDREKKAAAAAQAAASGQTAGPAPGQTADSASGQADAPAPEQSDTPAPGQADDSASGQAARHSSEQTAKPSSGQAAKPSSGQAGASAAEDDIQIVDLTDDYK